MYRLPPVYRIPTRREPDTGTEGEGRALALNYSRAQWREEQSADLAARAEAAPAIEGRLAEIHAQIQSLQAEAEEVARRLNESEASLIAAIGARDEHRLRALYTEFAELFETHYQIVREANEQIAG